MRLAANDRNGHAPILVNKHPCKESKELVEQAISKKRESGWKFVWVHNGHIFARKTGNAPNVKICSAKDVSKIANE